MSKRTIVWRREDVPGIEIAFVTVEEKRLRARGSAIAVGPPAYLLSYELETADDLTTRRFTATAEGLGWTRRIALRRDGAGGWSADASSNGAPDLPPAGANVEEIEGAPDVDLGFSPLTNTPPVIRSGLLTDAEPQDVDAAWVSVPDLAVRRLEQRYTFVSRDATRTIVRYETRDGSFTAELGFDPDGFVLRYPGLAVLEPG